MNSSQRYEILPSTNPIPPAANPIPVDTPLPSMVDKSPVQPKTTTFAKVRDFFSATDIDGARPEHGGNRTWATCNNGINAALAAGQCIPGMSTAVAPFTIGWGALKIFGILWGAIHGVYDAGVARGLVVSGAKNIALGASAFVLPGVSEAMALTLYATSATKDTADTLNAAIDRQTKNDTENS